MNVWMNGWLYCIILGIFILLCVAPSLWMNDCGWIILHSSEWIFRYRFVLVGTIPSSNCPVSFLFILLQVKQTGARTHTAESPTHIATRLVLLSLSSLIKAEWVCRLALVLFLCQSVEHSKGDRQIWSEVSGRGCSVSGTRDLSTWLFTPHTGLK